MQRTLTLALVLLGVVCLSGASQAAKGGAVHAAVRAAQSFENSKNEHTGRWVEMHKHSIAGIPFGKLTAHQALVRIVKGKSVVVTPMQSYRHYVGNGLGPMTIPGKARPSARVQSAKELAAWAKNVGLRFLSFQPEKKTAAPAEPAIRFPIGVRGLDLAPYTAPRDVPPPMMIRGLY